MSHAGSEFQAKERKTLAYSIATFILSLLLSLRPTLSRFEARRPIFRLRYRAINKRELRQNLPLHVKDVIDIRPSTDWSVCTWASSCLFANSLEHHFYRAARKQLLQIDFNGMWLNILEFIEILFLISISIRRYLLSALCISFKKIWFVRGEIFDISILLRKNVS